MPGHQLHDGDRFLRPPRRLPSAANVVGGSVCLRDSRSHGPGAYNSAKEQQSLPLKAERKSRSSKRRLDVNLRKRTRADCGELLRRVRVKGTYSLYKAASRRFPLQIDTRTKRQQMVHIFRDGRRKKTAQGSTPRLSPENCFLTSLGEMQLSSLP